MVKAVPSALARMATQLSYESATHATAARLKPVYVMTLNCAPAHCPGRRDQLSMCVGSPRTNGTKLVSAATAVLVLAVACVASKQWSLP